MQPFAERSHGAAIPCSRSSNVCRPGRTPLQPFVERVQTGSDAPAAVRWTCADRVGHPCSRSSNVCRPGRTPLQSFGERSQGARRPRGSFGERSHGARGPRGSFGERPRGGVDPPPRRTTREIFFLQVTPDVAQA